MENSELDAVQFPADLGGILRAARERRGLSRQEISGRLNWMPRYVAVVEEGRFDELPGRMFAVGYVLAYGKLLGLPKDELLAALASMGLSDEPPPRVSTAVRPPLWQKPVVSVVVGVVAALLLWLALWLHNSDEEQIPPTPPAETEASAAQGQEFVGPSPGALPAASSAAERGARPTRRAAEPLPASGPAPRPGATLRFSFTGDCWVEVYGANDELLHANLHDGGEDLTLSGEPPFKVLVGDVRTVTLSYQGEPVAIEPRPGGVVASFTVGAEQ